jgi:hypothetical protein
MSITMRANPGRANGTHRRLALIFSAAMLMGGIFSLSSSALSDGAGAGQTRTQPAVGAIYGGQRNPGVVGSGNIFPGSNGKALYICSPSGAGHPSICVPRSSE